MVCHTACEQDQDVRPDPARKLSANLYDIFRPDPARKLSANLYDVFRPDPARKLYDIYQ